MANPVKPNIDYSYTGFQQEQQDSPFPGTQIDNDLAELKRGIDVTIDALAQIRRADGALANGVVTLDSLSTDLSLVIGADTSHLDAVAAVADAVAAVVTVAEGVSDIAIVADNLYGILAAPAAAAVAAGAMTTLLDPQFATLATAQAYSPSVAPAYIRTAFYDANQVAGSGGVYRNNGGSTGDLVITLAGGGLVGYTLSGTPTAPQKGARKNNSADDAVAIKAAHDLGFGGVELPAGTYKMVPGSSSPFTLGNTASNIYRAVALTADNVTFSGAQAVLHGVSRSNPATADVQPVFSTDKNMTQGTRKNLAFEGVKFDSNNDGDAANSNQRFLYAVGVDGLKFLNTEAGSSGARRGYYANIQNCRDIQINAHYHHKMTGGFNPRYCENFVLTNFIFRDFSEAIDLDGTSKRVVIRNGVFEGTARTQQCIDINDQIDASIGDFSVYLVGNIATINYKTTTPDTYAEYVANSLVRNFQVGKRIIISNITGSAVGSSTQPSFYIGWDWSGGNHAGASPVQDVTLENITLDDHGYFDIKEAVNLKIRNVASYRAISGFSHALTCASDVSTGDRIGWSDLDIDIGGLRIEACDKGGISISAPSKAKIRGLVTAGNNTAGGSLTDLALTSLHSRAARVVVDECDIEGDVTFNGDSTTIAAWAANTIYKRNALALNGGNFYRAITEGRSAASGGPTGTALSVTDDGSASIAAWAGSTGYVIDDVRSNGGSYFICMTAGTSAASTGPAGTDQRIADGTVVWRPITGLVKWEYLLNPYSIRWGKNNRVRGAVNLQGDVNKYIYAEKQNSRIGDISATGTLNFPVMKIDRRSLIVGAAYAVGADVSVDASNYRTVLLRRFRAGVPTTIATIDTKTGLTAFIPVDGGVTAAATTLAPLERNDLVVLTSNSAGTGRALTGLQATISYMEF